MSYAEELAAKEALFDAEEVDAAASRTFAYEQDEGKAWWWVGCLPP